MKMPCGTAIVPEGRTNRYRSVAEKLRQLAARTRFDDIRWGYLELAYRFERLGEAVGRDGDATLAGAAGEDD